MWWSSGERRSCACAFKPAWLAQRCPRPLLTPARHLRWLCCPKMVRACTFLVTLLVAVSAQGTLLERERASPTSVPPRAEAVTSLHSQSGS